MTLPAWLREKKASARARYQQDPSPKIKYGLTIRLSTKGLDLTDHAKQDSEHVITLEHENCEVHNLFDVLDHPLVQQYLLSTPVADRTAFDDFIDAEFDIGLAVFVPKGASATLDLTKTLTSQSFKEYIFVYAHTDSTLTIIDKYHSEHTALRAGAVEIVCEENAKIRYANIQALTQDAVEIASYRAQLIGNHSKVEWFTGTFGASLVHANADSQLIGEASDAKSYGVFLGNNKQQFDLSASSFHKGDHSTSDMYTRGVLFDSAKAVYRGNIDIAADAFGCNGYQKEEVLLLSEKAVADAIPNLEIRNNDVKCSHGATIGRVDEEQLFYLKSRGIPQELATKMIVEGFFEPLTTRLDWPELFATLMPLVEEKLR